MKKAIPEIKRVVQKRGKIPSNTNTGKITPVSQINPMLIRKLKRPKLNNQRGSVSNFKIGFKKKLNSPRIAPAKKRICISPRKDTPEMNFVAKKSPKIPETICKSKFPTPFRIS